MYIATEDFIIDCCMVAGIVPDARDDLYVTAAIYEDRLMELFEQKK